MSEKLIKAVKRGNKKRSINITVGAVVGFLLSCTSVMGEDNYLWIKDDRGTIKFSTNNSVTPIDTANPYSENSWDGSTYINNMTLSGKNNDTSDPMYVRAYGLKLEDVNNFNFVNNGSITGTGDSSYGYGIYNSGGTITTLTNSGSIAGVGMDYGNEGYGIYNSGTITKLKNNGSIKGASLEGSAGGYGIENLQSIITTIINNGLIVGKTIGSDNKSYGISNKDFNAKIEALANNGLIVGTYEGDAGVGYGISNKDSNAKIEVLTNNGLIAGRSAGRSVRGYGINNEQTITTLTNTGVIYGKSNAVKNIGTISSAKNYGILANGDTGDVIDGLDINAGGNENLGLIIKNGTDITEGSGGTKEIIIGYDESGNEIKRNMTIENKGASDGKDSFSGSGHDNKILNALTNTYKVNTTDDKVAGSIINAYQTAVVFGGTNSQLTLSGTIVNGGADGTDAAVTGSGNKDILILQSGEVGYVVGVTGTQNTVINGNIDMAGGDDVLTVETGTIINGNINMGAADDTITIEAGSIVNGTLDGGVNNDTLNFNSPVVRMSSSDEIRIMHNISDFENININGNVTVYESTIETNGELTDLKISGVNTVTIGETGVLNLRLKALETTTNVNGDFIPNASHAFLGNNMVIQGEGNGVDTAGTLNFVTNGIGRKIYVDMTNIELKNLYIKTSSVIDGYEVNEKVSVILGAYNNLDEIYRPENAGGSSLTKERYESLNNIYKGIYSSTGDNLNALRLLISSDSLGNNYNENMSDEEQLKTLMSYLGSIYTETPYTFSSELSRKSAGMFRDIVTENHFRPDLNKWMIMGGLTHADGGTKDTYYGQNYHGFDTGTSDTNADMKLTGAYMLAKYGYSENISLGVTLGGNKSEAELSMSKVEGNSGYIGAFVENYRGNLTLKAGAGIQYSEYDADRRTIGGHSYDEKYSDMAYDIYLNGRYSHNIGENLFLEPYGTLSYTHIKQDGTDEGNKALAMETDSKSFDYTSAKVGVDIKKVISHDNGKSTLLAGVSYTRLFNGAEEEYITGRFTSGSDFDILVAHKNEHSLGLNAKYTLELENGILFDLKGNYVVERDSHNGAGKNKTKGEWIVGAGLGYKF